MMDHSDKDDKYSSKLKASQREHAELLKKL